MRVTLEVVWKWAMHFHFPQQVLSILCRYFGYQRRDQFEGCVADIVQTITAMLAVSKWSVLLQRIVMRDAMSDVLNVFPQLQMRVYVGDGKIHVWRINKEFPRHHNECVREFEGGGIFD